MVIINVHDINLSLKGVSKKNFSGSECLRLHMAFPRNQVQNLLNAQISYFVYGENRMTLSNFDTSRSVLIWDTYSSFSVKI